MVTDEMVATYQREGVVPVKGLMADWVAMLRAGVARNMASLGQPMLTLKPGETGAFLDDRCSRQRIPEFAAIIRQSPAAEVPAQLMKSRRVKPFHDRVLVKEPGTEKPTPGHTDGPHSFVERRQTVSFRISPDPVGKASLPCVAGSHLGPKDVLPTRWMAETSLCPGEHDFRPMPDLEADGIARRAWDLEPGDAVAFHFRTQPGARGNDGKTRRRDLSLRIVGRDARSVARPGPTSPPFPDPAMHPGDRLRENWSPVLWEELY
jgi:ectoine hydroxylase-related dioxygenase (phytanoyl-CoA dioxygenase family)